MESFLRSRKLIVTKKETFIFLICMVNAKRNHTSSARLRIAMQRFLRMGIGSRIRLMTRAAMKFMCKHFPVQERDCKSPVLAGRSLVGPVMEMSFFTGTAIG